eukprot:CCRYP_017749-RB/>CCRYP_017749-RB protein AED:0.22 eAED:0.49 QI:0/0/0/1/0.33/0.25/4/0/322
MAGIFHILELSFGLLEIGQHEAPVSVVVLFSGEAGDKGCIVNPYLASSVVMIFDPVKTSHTSGGLATSDTLPLHPQVSFKEPKQVSFHLSFQQPYHCTIKKSQQGAFHSPTSCTSKSPNMTTSPPVYCRRALKEGEEPVKEKNTLEHGLGIIEEMATFDAKSHSLFLFTYDLISCKSCDADVEYTDKSLAHVMECGVELPVGSFTGAEHVHDAWTPSEDEINNQFNKKLHAEDLVDLIGHEETLKIIDFFEQSLGNLTIDCLYLARHGEPAGELYVVPWHIDDYATLEITLNNNYEGGHHVLHLNADSVHKTDNHPGSATVE